MVPTKRTIDARLEELERKVGEKRERTEILIGYGVSVAPEPQLTDYLVSLGFVVEREVRTHSSGYEDVQLHTTPSSPEIFQSICWHSTGRTALREDIRIMWEEDSREAILADADYPARYIEPDYPDGPIVVEEGDGWMAVVPQDRVIKNTVTRRSTAERQGYEIIRSVPSWVPDADEYDLVEVSTETVSS